MAWVHRTHTWPSYECDHVTRKQRIHHLMPSLTCRSPRCSRTCFLLTKRVLWVEGVYRWKDLILTADSFHSKEHNPGGGRHIAEYPRDFSSIFFYVHILFSLKMTALYGQESSSSLLLILLQEPSTVVSKEILGTLFLNQVESSLKLDGFPWISTFGDISSSVDSFALPDPGVSQSHERCKEKCIGTVHSNFL